MSISLRAVSLLMASIILAVIVLPSMPNTHAQSVVRRDERELKQGQEAIIDQAQIERGTELKPEPCDCGGEQARSGDVRSSLYRGKSVTYSAVNGMAVFEGDIILGTVEDLENSGIALQSIGIEPLTMLWPNGIVPFTNATQQFVIDAINHWNSHSGTTGVRLVPRTNQADFINFNYTDGCRSYVGRQRGEQQVWIGGRCDFGAIVHEIGHAIGLWHEQSREDRDTRIRINWGNIEAEQEHNFNQHINDGMDLGPYDYNSIMHYPTWAFSRNGQPTIETIPPGIPIGQRNGLSASDLAGVRQLYTQLYTSPSGRYRDVNGDGRDDLVLLNNGAAILRFSSGSSFGQGQVFDGHTINDKLGDFNGDGRHDVIQFWNGRSVISLSTGSGFGPWTDWGTGHTDDDQIGDFNGDGKDDVIQLWYGRSIVWLSTGTTFTPWKDWGTGHTNNDRVGDFNGDGRDDVIQFYNGRSLVSLSTGNGFGPWRDWGTGHTNNDQVGDFNGDGRDDVIQLWYGRSIVWLSTGTTFTPWKDWGTGHTNNDRVGDFNGDGRDDVIQLWYGRSVISLSTGTAFGSWRDW